MTTPPLNFDPQVILQQQFDLIARLQQQAAIAPNAENLERFNLAVEGACNLMQLTIASLQISGHGGGRSGGPD
jgi:hypothetical protein